MATLNSDQRGVAGFCGGAGLMALSLGELSRPCLWLPCCAAWALSNRLT